MISKKTLFHGHLCTFEIAHLTQIPQTLSKLIKIIELICAVFISFSFWFHYTHIWPQLILPRDISPDMNPHNPKVYIYQTKFSEWGERSTQTATQRYWEIKFDFSSILYGFFAFFLPTPPSTFCSPDLAWKFISQDISFVRRKQTFNFQQIARIPQNNLCKVFAIKTYLQHIKWSVKAKRKGGWKWKQTLKMDMLSMPFLCSFVFSFLQQFRFGVFLSLSFEM